MSTRTVRVVLSGDDTSLKAALSRTKTGMQQLNTQSSKMKTGLAGLTSGFGNLNNVLMQFGLALGAAQLARTVGQLVTLGDQVRKTEVTFTQLTGGAQNAESALAQLRQATGGIVSDMLLMKSANAFIIQGLAETSEQAANLTSTAIKLGGAMGLTATQSIDNFTRLLRNQSIRLLDEFGLRAGTVRARVIELQAANEGMSREMAFSAAVTEEATRALDQLGSAALAAETSMAKLGTRLQNTKEDIAQFLFEGVEAGAQLSELAIRSIEEGSGQGGFGISEIFGLLTGTGVGADIRAGFDRGQEFAEFAPSQKEEASRVSSLFAQRHPDIGGVSTLDVANVLFGPIGGGAVDVEDDNIRRIIGMQRLIILQDEQAELRATNERIQALETNFLIADLLSQAFNIAPLGQSAVDFIGGQGTGRAGNALPQMLTGSQQLLGGRSMISREDADTLARRAEQGQVLFEEFQRIDDELEALGQVDLISNDDIDAAEAMADEMADIAKEAQKAADALEKASLSMLLGVGDGGRRGEIVDAFAAGISDEDARARFLEFANLEIGRDTLMNQLFEEQIVPLGTSLAAGGDITGATELATRFNQLLTSGAEQGINLEAMAAGGNLDILQALGIFGPLGGGTGGQAFTVNPGDTAFGLGAQLGIPFEQLLAAQGLSPDQGRQFQPGTFNLPGADATFAEWNPDDALARLLGLAGSDDPSFLQQQNAGFMGGGQFIRDFSDGSFPGQFLPPMGGLPPFMGPLVGPFGTEPGAEGEFGSLVDPLITENTFIGPLVEGEVAASLTEMSGILTDEVAPALEPITAEMAAQDEFMDKIQNNWALITDKTVTLTIEVAGETSALGTVVGGGRTVKQQTQDAGGTPEGSDGRNVGNLTLVP